MIKPCKTYSFTWSLKVYGTFQRKYPRATHIFRVITNHGKDYPAWLLGHNQEKWLRYKKVIKYIDKLDEHYKYPPTSDKYFRLIEDDLAQNEIYPIN